MTFLPVVVRELTVAARSPLTTWLRFFSVLVAGGIAGGLMLASGSTGISPRELPGTIFGLISSLLFGWCFLSGVVLTADCLSSERRQGTLGLLFLTDLSGFDVVLGKAAAASAQAVSVVFAVLPVLALPLMMGSVTWGQFLRMAIALLFTLFWSLALGAAVSAGQRDGRRAVLTALGLLLALLLLPLGVMSLFQYFGWGRVDATVGALTPLSLVFGAYEGAWASKIGHQSYLHGLWLVGATALGSLAAASWWLPRAWRDSESAEGSPTGGKRREPALVAPSRSSGGERKSRADELRGTPVIPRARFRDSPYEQLVNSSLQVPGAIGWIMVLAGLVWVGCVGKIAADEFIGGRTRNEGAALTLMLTCAGLHVLVKVVTAVIASQRASDDTANGAMELLLTTPLQPATIRRGHLDSMASLLFRTKVLLSVANLISPVAVWAGLKTSVEDWFPFTFGFVAGIATLWLDTRLIAELGLICGIRRRHHARAAFEAAARTLVPGWVGFLGTFLIGASGVNGTFGVSVLFTLCAAWCLGTSWLQLVACGHLGNIAFMELTGGAWAFGRRPRVISGAGVHIREGVVVS